jgi:hypothetical protein
LFSFYDDAALGDKLTNCTNYQANELASKVSDQSNTAMNSTLQHISSKPKDGSGKKTKSKLPKEAAIFAKQMGLDLSGLEAEADGNLCLVHCFSI